MSSVAATSEAVAVPAATSTNVVDPTLSVPEVTETTTILTTSTPVIESLLDPMTSTTAQLSLATIQPQIENQTTASVPIQDVNHINSINAEQSASKSPSHSHHPALTSSSSSSSTSSSSSISSSSSSSPPNTSQQLQEQQSQALQIEQQIAQQMKELHELQQLKLREEAEKQQLKERKEWEREARERERERENERQHQHQRGGTSATIAAGFYQPTLPSLTPLPPLNPPLFPSSTSNSHLSNSSLLSSTASSSTSSPSYPVPSPTASYAARPPRPSSRSSMTASSPSNASDPSLTGLTQFTSFSSSNLNYSTATGSEHSSAAPSPSSSSAYHRYHHDSTSPLSLTTTGASSSSSSHPILPPSSSHSTGRTSSSNNSSVRGSFVSSQSPVPSPHSSLVSSPNLHHSDKRYGLGNSLTPIATGHNSGGVGVATLSNIISPFGPISPMSASSHHHQQQSPYASPTNLESPYFQQSTTPTPTGMRPSSQTRMTRRVNRRERDSDEDDEEDENDVDVEEQEMQHWFGRKGDPNSKTLPHTNNSKAYSSSSSSSQRSPTTFTKAIFDERHRKNLTSSLRSSFPCFNRFYSVFNSIQLKLRKSKLLMLVIALTVMMIGAWLLKNQVIGNLIDEGEGGEDRMMMEDREERRSEEMGGVGGRRGEIAEEIERNYRRPQAGLDYSASDEDPGAIGAAGPDQFAPRSGSTPPPSRSSASPSSSSSSGDDLDLHTLVSSHLSSHVPTSSITLFTIFNPSSLPSSSSPLLTYHALYSWTLHFPSSLLLVFVASAPDCSLLLSLPLLQCRIATATCWNKGENESPKLECLLKEVDKSIKAEEKKNGAGGGVGSARGVAVYVDNSVVLFDSFASAIQVVSESLSHLLVIGKSHSLPITLPPTPSSSTPFAPPSHHSLSSFHSDLLSSSLDSFSHNEHLSSSLPLSPSLLYFAFSLSSLPTLLVGVDEKKVLLIGEEDKKKKDGSRVKGWIEMMEEQWLIRRQIGVVDVTQAVNTMQLVVETKERKLQNIHPGSSSSSSSFPSASLLTKHVSDLVSSSHYELVGSCPLCSLKLNFNPSLQYTLSRFIDTLTPITFLPSPSSTLSSSSSHTHAVAVAATAAAAHAVSSLSLSIGHSKHVILVTVNSNTLLLANNWICRADSLHISNFLFLAEDRLSYGYLVARSIPVLLLKGAPYKSVATSAGVAVSGGSKRNDKDESLLQSMSILLRKLELIQTILGMKYDILLMNVDSIVFNSPIPLFHDETHSCDVIVENTRKSSPDKAGGEESELAGESHVDAMSDHLMMIKSSVGGVRFIEEYYNCHLDNYQFVRYQHQSADIFSSSSSSSHTDDDSITNCLESLSLLDSASSPSASTPPRPLATKCYFDPLLFPSESSFFESQISIHHNVLPVLVHMNGEVEMEAKVRRMKRWGLWMYDEVRAQTAKQPHTSIITKRTDQSTAAAATASMISSAINSAGGISDLTCSFPPPNPHDPLHLLPSSSSTSSSSSSSSSSPAISLDSVSLSIYVLVSADSSALEATLDSLLVVDWKGSGAMTNGKDGGGEGDEKGKRRKRSDGAGGSGIGHKIDLYLSIQQPADENVRSSLEYTKSVKMCENLDWKHGVKEVTKLSKYVGVTADWIDGWQLHRHEKEKKKKKKGADGKELESGDGSNGDEDDVSANEDEEEEKLHLILTAGQILSPSSFTYLLSALSTYYINLESGMDNHLIGITLLHQDIILGETPLRRFSGSIPTFVPTPVGNQPPPPSPTSSLVSRIDEELSSTQSDYYLYQFVNLLGTVFLPHHFQLFMSWYHTKTNHATSIENINRKLACIPTLISNKWLLSNDQREYWWTWMVRYTFEFGLYSLHLAAKNQMGFVTSYASPSSLLQDHSQVLNLISAFPPRSLLRIYDLHFEALSDISVEDTGSIGGNYEFETSLFAIRSHSYPPDLPLMVVGEFEERKRMEREQKNRCYVLGEGETDNGVNSAALAKKGATGAAGAAAGAGSDDYEAILRQLQIQQETAAVERIKAEQKAKAKAAAEAAKAAAAAASAAAATVSPPSSSPSTALTKPPKAIETLNKAISSIIQTARIKKFRGGVLTPEDVPTHYSIAELFYHLCVQQTTLLTDHNLDHVKMILYRAATTDSSNFSMNMKGLYEAFIIAMMTKRMLVIDWSELEYAFDTPVGAATNDKDKKQQQPTCSWLWNDYKTVLTKSSSLTITPTVLTTAVAASSPSTPFASLFTQSILLIDAPSSSLDFPLLSSPDLSLQLTHLFGTSSRMRRIAAVTSFLLQKPKPIFVKHVEAIANRMGLPLITKGTVEERRRNSMALDLRLIMSSSDGAAMTQEKQMAQVQSFIQCATTILSSSIFSSSISSPSSPSFFFYFSTNIDLRSPIHRLIFDSLSTSLSPHGSVLSFPVSVLNDHELGRDEEKVKKKQEMIEFWLRGEMEYSVTTNFISTSGDEKGGSSLSGNSEAMQGVFAAARTKFQKSAWIWRAATGAANGGEKDYCGPLHRAELTSAVDVTL